MANFATLDAEEIAKLKLRLTGFQVSKNILIKAYQSDLCSLSFFTQYIKKI